MIQPLLNYQQKEKEKLELLVGVETSRTKREFDEAARLIETAKRTLLALENDAKILHSTYESVSKNLNEIFEKTAAFNKTVNQNPSEEDAATALNFVSGLLSKVNAYEAQLADINRKINEKTNLFEETCIKAGRVQKSISSLQEEYEKQKKQIEPKVRAIESELKSMEKNVNANLLEKYKSIRKGDKRNRTADIVVPLNGNRCGGCHFELPLSLIHTISTNGFIVCEECGKIIYK